MEGEEALASIDTLWFYSSVFYVQPPSERKSGSAGELRTRQRNSAETQATSGDSSGTLLQVHRRVEAREEVAAMAAAERRTGARIWDLDERVEIWRRKQQRRAVSAPVRCSPSRMLPTGDGLAMKAHLRSWAHAVACSVR